MARPQASLLDRALRAFADVRPGESLTALLLALNVFVILMSYYLLKPVREALILGQGSPELKSYLSVGQVALLAVVVPLYGRLVAALPRMQLLRVVAWFFIACLVTFYVLAQIRVPLGVVFFLWIGIFNLMIVAQFWAFANDIYDRDEGERLFPIVGFGASLGAVMGSLTADRLIGALGIYQVLLAGAAGLFLQLQISRVVDRREGGRSSHPPVPAAEAPKPSNTRAFALVFRNRYLLAMGLMLLMFFWVDATGEYILGSIISDRANEYVASGQAAGAGVEDVIGRFYSRYFGMVNAASLLIQLFLVSRIIKYLGVPMAVCLLPALSMTAYGIIAFVPGIWYLLGAKVAEKSTDYSLNNTVRNMLFLPCTHEEKYSAKQTIDSLFVRLGDVASAGLVALGTTVLGLTTTQFATINVVLAAVGLGLAFFVGKTYRSLTTAPRPKLSPGADPPFDPDMRSAPARHVNQSRTSPAQGTSE